MKRVNLRPLVALTLALSLPLSSPALAGVEQWYAAGIAGEARVKPGGKGAFLPVDVGRSFGPRDRVSTGPGSSLDIVLKIVLEGVASVGLGKETEIVIRSVTPRRTTLQARKGTARIQKSPGADQQLEVVTATAALVVYGTVVEIKVDEDPLRPQTLACPMAVDEGPARKPDGGVAIGLPDEDERFPIPLGLCREVSSGRVGEPIPRPDSFPPLGPAPSAGVSRQLAARLLFGSRVGPPDVAAPPGGPTLCSPWICEDPTVRPPVSKKPELSGDPDGTDPPPPPPPPRIRIGAPETPSPPIGIVIGGPETP